MLVKGKFAEAKIYSEDIEQYAVAQIQMICDNDVAKGSKIRVMPDVHPGKVGPVGLTMTLQDRVLPSLLGVDIGCGVLCVELKAKHLEYQQLDKVIREKVPSGFAVRSSPHSMAGDYDFGELLCSRNINLAKAQNSLGTLGGGNHFIEIDKDEEGKLYLVIHTGSRHLGVEVTEHYLRLGREYLKGKGEKADYHLTYLEGELMENYLQDVLLVQNYAALNRQIIAREIMKGLKVKGGAEIASVHNYIDYSNGQKLLRKGAISAQAGEQVLIPINMAEGMLMGYGRGNGDWNCSAPHGSGRLYRRDEVKQHYTVSAFKTAMKGIYSSSVGADTLDEAPFAYRNLETIAKQIGETVEIKKIIRPVYSFKAGGKA
ncbi:MAG: RtcB family protein [Acidaminococcaceae bacterium]|nr:RtcB family protein [Acidaminococcaceae bacterium]